MLKLNWKQKGFIPFITMGISLIILGLLMLNSNVDFFFKDIMGFGSFVTGILASIIFGYLFYDSKGEIE